MAHQDPTWTIIPNFEGHQVNSSGEIRNVATGKVLKSSVNDTGVRYVSILNTTMRKYQNVAVSVIVASTFCPGQSLKENTVLHLNGRTEDNRSENLMWASRWHAITFHKEMNTKPRGAARGRRVKDQDGREYAGVYEAAEVTGCLPSAISYALTYNDNLAQGEHINFVHRVFPGGHTFTSA